MWHFYDLVRSLIIMCLLHIYCPVQQWQNWSSFCDIYGENIMASFIYCGCHVVAKWASILRCRVSCWITTDDIVLRIHSCWILCPQYSLSQMICKVTSLTKYSLERFPDVLPVRQRVLFKTAVLVFQCLASQAPSYLSDNCQPVSHSRPCRLQSSDSLTCIVRRAHNTYGDQCFATAGPRVLNSLPIELQQCDSLGRFKRCLKTFLFGSWNYGTLWLFVK